MSRELDLVDELLALVDGTDAIAIDVTGDGFSIRIRRRVIRRKIPSEETHGAASRRVEDSVQQVKSPAVGIFSAEKEWKFHGVKRCDGIDPEGNVFQLQEVPA